MRRVAMGLVCMLAICTTALGERPIQLSLTPEIALFDQDTMIRGLVLNVWGENPQRALALGVVNGSRDDSKGFTWALLLNYAEEDYSGVQWAPINYVRSDFLGWQGALINYTDGMVRGLQTGAVNYAGTLRGLQFGLFNFADGAEGGVQIGLINLIRENTRWFTGLPDEVAPGMVFVNWRL